jgi:hypothetical protein
MLGLGLMLVLRVGLMLVLGLLLMVVFLALSLKVGLLGLMLMLLPKATHEQLSQRARPRCSAIQTSTSCAHSSSRSINGIAGESNDNESEIVPLLQSPGGVLFLITNLTSPHYPATAEMLEVSSPMRRLYTRLM